MWVNEKRAKRHSVKKVNITTEVLKLVFSLSSTGVLGLFFIWDDILNLSLEYKYSNILHLS
jgi:hypothetical protein